MIIKIKQFIEKRLKQLFIKNEMNTLSFKIENECFMDGSKSKTFAIYSPLKTVYLCIEKVYNTANILQIHGINVDTQKDIIDIDDQEVIIYVYTKESCKKCLQYNKNLEKIESGDWVEYNNKNN